MASDVLLRLKDIKGESTKIPEHIDVVSWNWGVSQSGGFGTGTGTGGTTGKASFQDISITKYTDSASKTITQFISKGTHFADASLICRKSSGADPVDFYVINMTDVMLTSYSIGGSGGDGDLMETISLAFASYEILYKGQANKGTAMAELPFKFSIQEGVEIS
jgi:type VI secretion system secreted protein Hcp